MDSRAGGRGRLPFPLEIVLALVLSTAGAAEPPPAEPRAPALSVQSLLSGAVELSWPDETASFVLEETEVLGGSNVWRRVIRRPEVHEGRLSLVTVPDAPGRYHRLALPLTHVVETSPVAGEPDVSVQRETILRFSQPLAPEALVTTNHFRADAEGRRLLTRVQLAADRRSVALFYLEPLPGNARVYVRFDGEGLVDELRRPLDPEGDGTPGGTLQLRFDTLNLTPVARTAVVGRVLAAEPEVSPGGASLDHPLAGVTITVDGREESLRAVTAADGSFRLEPVPAGRFFVHIDGRTAFESRYPNGAYYPFVGKAWDAVAGVGTNLAGGTGEIFLPRIRSDTLRETSAHEATSVGFPDSVIATNPALGAVRITVPANSLFHDNGTRGGRVGVAPVPPTRLPGPLPAGLQIPMVFTVQTDGAGNFDQPAPVCLPNVASVIPGAPLPPGAKRSLISFNHKRGVWESVGLMTVAADGLSLCTDPGVGIRQPGWHGAGVPPFVGPANDGGFAVASGSAAGNDGGGFASASGSANGGSSGGAPGGDDGVPPDQGNPASGGGGPGAGGGSGSGTDGGGGNGGGGGAGGSASDEPPPPAPCPENDLGRCLDRATEEKQKCDANKHETLDAYHGQCLGQEQRLGTQNPIVRACWATYKSLYFQATLACNQLKVDYTATCAPCAESAPSPSLAAFLGHDSKSPARSLAGEGGADVLAAVEGLIEAAARIIAPFVDAGVPIPAGARSDFDALVAQAETLAGGDTSHFARQESARLEADGPARFRSHGDLPGNAPAYPIHYLATAIRPSGMAHVRGQTGALGRYELFIPGDGTLLHIRFYDPRTRRFGMVYPHRRPETQFMLPPVRLVGAEPASADRDQDGLADLAEDVVGTDPDSEDTDGDGAPDGTEVEQGANPLDGIAVQTGILASVDTPGRALDVAVVSDLGAVADSEAGVALFDLANPTRPLLLTRIDTPGEARRVALAARHVAVADGPAGLALIDTAGPLPWFVRQQLNLGSAVRAVAAADRIVYAALESREVVALDLFTGLELGRLRLGGATDIQDLLPALRHGILYVLTTAELLVVELADAAGPAAVVGRTPAPGLLPGGFRPRRLTAVGDRLYASDRRGFTVFGVQDPRQPVRLAQTATPQFGWKQLLPVGPRLAVSPAGPDSVPAANHDLHVYELDEAGTNATFLTSIPTPGVASAVAVWKGLAYVADDGAGLQAINFLGTDTIRTPPSVTLADPSLSNPAAVVEGQMFRVAARAEDDLLIRAVEFYLDERLVGTAGRFPFEREVLAPLRIEGRTRTRLRARAIDLAGRTAWSEERPLDLLADTRPPVVDFTVPASGRFVPSRPGLVLGAAFDERIASASVTTASFRLAGAGANGLFGDADDLALPNTAAGYREDVRTAWLAIPGTLAPGAYRATLAPGIQDAAGNPLAAPVDFAFEIVRADLRPGGSLASAGAIDRAGARDVLAFLARAGQTLYFDEVDGSCASGLQWRCLGPEGAVVFDETLGGLSCGSDVGARTLGLDGEYTVEITSAPGVTNAWKIGIHDVPPALSWPIELGTTISEDRPVPGAGRLETPGSRDRYSFTAAAGTAVFFHESSGDCTSRLKWRCEAPDGTVVFDETLGGLGCGRHAGWRRLSQAGEYTLTVSGAEDAVGPYTFEIWPAEPEVFGLTLPAVITSGQPGPGAGTLETPGARDTYTFVVPPGARVRLANPEAAPALVAVTYLLTDEDGQRVFESCLRCTAPGVLTLSRGGTYTLQVGDADDAGVGAYRLELTPAP